MTMYFYTEPIPTRQVRDESEFYEERVFEDQLKAVLDVSDFGCHLRWQTGGQTKVLWRGFSVESCHVWMVKGYLSYPQSRVIDPILTFQKMHYKTIYWVNKRPDGRVSDLFTEFEMAKDHGDQLVKNDAYKNRTNIRFFG